MMVWPAEWRKHNEIILGSRTVVRWQKKMRKFNLRKLLINAAILRDKLSDEIWLMNKYIYIH